MEIDPFLFDYINDNNFEDFKKLINGSINSRSPKNGFTPFLLSVYQGKIEFVKFLFDNGANVSLSGVNGMKAVHFAALKDNVEVLKFLKEKSLNLSDTCDDDLNALHIAAREGSINCAQYLIKECHYLIDSKTIDGFTPLHFAVFNDNKDIVHVLLGNNADVNIKCNDLSPAELAQKLGNVEIANLITDFNVTKPEIINAVQKIIKEDNVDVFRKLCEKYQYVIYLRYTANNYTLLHLIILGKSEKCFDYFLEKYDDCGLWSIRDSKNKLPLDRLLDKYSNNKSVKSDYHKIIKIFLEKSLAERDHAKGALFKKAFDVNDRELCSYLIEKKCFDVDNICLMITNPNSYFDQMIDASTPDMLSSIEIKTAYTLLLRAFKCNKEKAFIKLLEHGADPFVPSVRIDGNGKNAELAPGNYPLIYGLIRIKRKDYVDLIINHYPKFRERINEEMPYVGTLLNSALAVGMKNLAAELRELGAKK